MKSEINWLLQVDNSVFKFLKKLTKNDRERIYSSIKKLEVDPYAGDIKKMKNAGDSWRLRIGSYRVFFEIHIEEKVIYVFHAERRTTTTY